METNFPLSFHGSDLVSIRILVLISKKLGPQPKIMIIGSFEIEGSGSFHTAVMNFKQGSAFGETEKVTVTEIKRVLDAGLHKKVAFVLPDYYELSTLKQGSAIARRPGETIELGALNDVHSIDIDDKGFITTATGRGRFLSRVLSGGQEVWQANDGKVAFDTMIQKEIQKHKRAWLKPHVKSVVHGSIEITFGETRKISCNGMMK